MNLLNLYFTPFAAAMVVVAVYFSEPTKKITYTCFGILALSLAVNHWFSKNTYRFIGWTQKLKTIQVWLTFLWSVLLFYLLFPYFAPMWLLLAMPAVTAALYQSRGQALVSSVVSGLTVLFVYYLRFRGNPVSGMLWAQACVHAAFVPVLALFVHALAQTAIQMRDIRSRV